MKKALLLVLFFSISSLFVFASVVSIPIPRMTNNDSSTDHLIIDVHHILYDTSVGSYLNLIEGKDYEMKPITSKTYNPDTKQNEIVETYYFPSLNDEGLTKLLESGAITLQGTLTKNNAFSSKEITYKSNEWNRLFPEDDKSNYLALFNTIYSNFQKNALNSIAGELNGFSAFANVLDTVQDAVINALSLNYQHFTNSKNVETLDGVEEVLKIKDPSSNPSSNDNKGTSYLSWILLSLLSFELIVLAISGFIKGEAPIQELVIRFLMCILIMFLITNLWNITSFASKVFIRGGNIAGYDQDSEKTETLLKDNTTLHPSEVMRNYQRSKIVFDTAKDKVDKEIGTINGAKFGFVHLDKLLIGLGFIIGKVLLFIIYAITSIYVLLWQVELRVLIIIAVFLLPFKIFKYTDFLAKGIWPTLLGQCVKLFVCTFIVRISGNLFKGTFQLLQEQASKTGYDVSFMLWGYIPGCIAVAIIISYFTLKAPETARALLIGQPTTDGNIQGMAVKMGTKAMMAPAASVAIVNKAIKTQVAAFGDKAKALRGQDGGPGVDPDKHSGARSSFINGGISGMLTYGLVRGIQHTAQGIKNRANASAEISKSGINTSSPNASAEQFKE